MVNLCVLNFVVAFQVKHISRTLKVTRDETATRLDNPTTIVLSILIAWELEISLGRHQIRFSLILFEPKDNYHQVLIVFVVDFGMY